MLGNEGLETYDRFFSPRSISFQNSADRARRNRSTLPSCYFGSCRNRDIARRASTAGFPILREGPPEKANGNSDSNEATSHLIKLLNDLANENCDESLPKKKVCVLAAPIKASAPDTEIFQRTILTPNYNDPYLYEVKEGQRP